MDMLVMDPDGGNKRRLTAFNHPGAPGHTGEVTMPMRPRFNKDGTRFSVTEQPAWGYPGRRRLWVCDLDVSQLG
jgi:hypothetical protein